ncbi:MAG: CDP-diacylglycerol--glycerol-3-phosphate 3-phosphatidyltransferase [Pseudomonadota bacterium]
MADTMSWKWLPNALTLLRCVLAFVVGWSILGIEAATQDMAGLISEAQELLSGVEALTAATDQLDAIIVGMQKASALLVLPFLWFVLVAMTDFLDGFLARRLDAVSEFGAFLDPIADKLLVAISLLALCQVAEWPLHLWVPALVIISRDIMVTLLRLLREGTLPVTRLAKWKTAAEMIGIGGFLLGFAVQGLTGLFVDGFEDQRQAALIAIYAVSSLSLFLVWIAAVLSAYTGWLYLRSARA